MNILPSRLLNTLTRTVNKLFTTTCLIEAPVMSTGQFGEKSRLWQTVAANLPCRVISVGGRYKSSTDLVGSEISLRDSYRLIVPVGTALGVGQRATINGAIYDIDSVQQSQTNALFYEAFITRQR